MKITLFSIAGGVGIGVVAFSIGSVDFIDLVSDGGSFADQITSFRV